MFSIILGIEGQCCMKGVRIEGEPDFDKSKV